MGVAPVMPAHHSDSHAHPTQNTHPDAHTYTQCHAHPHICTHHHLSHALPKPSSSRLPVTLLFICILTSSIVKKKKYILYLTVKEKNGIVTRPLLSLQRVHYPAQNFHSYLTTRKRRPSGALHTRTSSRGESLGRFQDATQEILDESCDIPLLGFAASGPHACLSFLRRIPNTALNVLMHY